MGTQIRTSLTGTLIKHRTSAMQMSLEQALISGQGDMGPNEEWEALKVLPRSHTYL